MLSLPEFLALPPPERLSYVWEKAYLLGTRLKGDQAVVKLYQMGFFFVEIEFGLREEFRLIDAFTDTSRLLPYLDHLDLSPLLPE